MKKIPQTVVQKTDKTLTNFFSILGFNADEQVVFTALSQLGTQTPLELSRATKLPRTRIYRMLENLKAKGYIVEIIDEHRSLARAIDMNELNSKITAKQKENEQLLHLFPLVSQEMTASMHNKTEATQVLFYRGKQGLMQMVWHTLRAKEECVGYTYRRLEEYLGEDFMMDWRDAYMKKGLIFRDIYSDEYLSSVKSQTQKVIYPFKHFPSRYVPGKLLNVNLQLDIYNDVVAQYNWHEGDVFGVEIINPKIAAFHKQMFEIIWKLGKEG